MMKKESVTDELGDFIWFFSGAFILFWLIKNIAYYCLMLSALVWAASAWLLTQFGIALLRGYNRVRRLFA